MRILICGADGFLGRHLSAALQAAGHTIVRGVHTARCEDDIAINYMRDVDAATWAPRLSRIDAVINAVGILIESREQTFERIHAAAPCALFDACAARRSIRVVQISALGVERGSSGYFRSKLQADRHLAAHADNWAIVRPGLIYGADGASSRLLRTLASLPLIALPGDGAQPLQPIHVDDLCEVVLRLLESHTSPKRVFEIAGPEPIQYRELLAAYRRNMNLGPPRFIPLPMPLMRVTARLAESMPQRVLSRDTLTMLADGNTTASKDAESLLGRPPLPADQFIPAHLATPLRLEAVNGWIRPLLLLALATMWIAAGVTSLAQPALSLELLADVGLAGGAALAMLFAASALDIVLGLLTVTRPSRGLWMCQIGLVVLYSAILGVWAPEHWLHPFGPVVKNLPILVILFALSANTARGTSWNT